MGMLDTLKRWFGGGDKPAPARPAPQMRAPAPNPVVVPAQTPTPAPIPVAQPAPLSAADVLDVIAKASAKPAPPVSNERRERPRINAKDGTRVLVIDDSPTIVALLKRMLEQSGYTALEAIDAETGVALALSVVPDLIFLDIVLPGMNGFEALRRLRRDPISKTIPIIMISGNELATEQFYAQRIGADDFMKKPFSRSEVFARIEKLLDADKVIRRRVAPVATIHAVASNPVAAPAAEAPAVAPAAAAPAAVGAPVAAPAPPLSPVASAAPATTPAPPQQAASN
ncbi:MAG TPA: response regulator [Xanthomonadaceae bacterium]|nr:response regulator [Xanthomonadaceae bacterium]